MRDPHPSKEDGILSPEQPAEREESLVVFELIKAFLTEEGWGPASVPATAWETFFLTYDRTIQAVARDRPECRHGVEDVVQEVWQVLIQRLRKLQFDPDRGTLRAWVLAVIRHEVARQARRWAGA